jgi:hypothetical protein
MYMARRNSKALRIRLANGTGSSKPGFSRLGHWCYKDGQATIAQRSQRLRLATVVDRRQPWREIDKERFVRRPEAP